MIETMLGIYFFDLMVTLHVCSKFEPTSESTYALKSLSNLIGSSLSSYTIILIMLVECRS